jgi:hypothetical protein
MPPVPSIWKKYFVGIEVRVDKNYVPVEKFWKKESISQKLEL